MLSLCLRSSSHRCAAATLRRRLAPAASALASLVLLLAAGLAWAGATHAADIDVIAGADSVEVAAQLRINGIPTRIREFVIDQPIAAVLEHYRHLLGHRRVENQLGDATVLAQRDGDTLQVIRLLPLGPASTAGTLSRANLAAARARHHHAMGFQPPRGSVLTSDIEMSDPGKDARFLAWHNTGSITRNADHLVRELGARGYHPDHGAAATAPASTATTAGRTLWFAGAGVEALATLLPSATGTTVTLNLVRHRTGVTP